ncbi:unnamed protein product [Polarella glacialis]|uniref:AMP-dependent synthetase/ligase domain-containing protein n=1 Tax=Polarella glacialis TaxID=89957 RepID=A0A813FU49_POLGL|nr:unnamed protein product [Polarella glacialis]
MADSEPAAMLTYAEASLQEPCTDWAAVQQRAPETSDFSKQDMGKHATTVSCMRTLLTASAALHRLAPTSQLPLEIPESKPLACGDCMPSLLAVKLRRTHPDFIPMLLAGSRRGLPIVLLSTDLPDKQKEAEREEFVLRGLGLGPGGILVFEDADQDPDSQTFKARGAAHAVSVARLAEAGQQMLADCSVTDAPVGPSDILCILFTGGTQRMKVVKGSHAMLLHELQAYPDVAPKLAGAGWASGKAPCPRLQPKVLGNLSAYWPAATWGQLSLCIAFGGCFVVTEAKMPSELNRVVTVQKVDVLGLVPDQLALLSQEPVTELPWVRLVITWADKLPPSAARPWANHPQAQFRELLIATEYWLSLQAEPLSPEPSVARLVPGVRAIVLPMDTSDEAPGKLAQQGEIGELCLAGRMVSPGYLDVGTGQSVRPAFFRHNDEDYFRSGDLVRVVSSGFVFVGRSDMLTKEKGQWVDMAEVEGRLQALDSVTESKIMPDPACPADFHAFVVPSDFSAGTDHLVVPGTVRAPPEALQQVRAALPQRVRLHVLRAMPRHCATHKVDTAELRRIIALSTPECWRPSEAGADPSFGKRRLKARLDDKMWRQAIWTAALLLAGLFGTGSAALHAASDSRCRHPLGNAFCRAPLGVLSMAYMFLATLHLEPVSPQSVKLMQEFPLGRFGLIAALHLLGSFSRGARSVVATWSFAGAACAWWRRRLLSWPAAFWAGAGHQAEMEGRWWVTPEPWQRHLLWRVLGVLQRVRRSALLLLRREPVVRIESPSTPAVNLEKGPQSDERVDAEEEQEARRQRRAYENKWWYECLEENLEVSTEQVQQAAEMMSRPPEDCSATRGTADAGSTQASSSCGPRAEAEHTEAARQLLALVEQADARLSPAALDTSLLGMDSLRTSILTSLIRTATGVLLGVSDVRQATTPRQLLEVICQERLRNQVGLEHKDQRVQRDQEAEADQEFAVWWSPGQNVPMGAWVLRTDKPVDHDALLKATQALVDQHPALRVQKVDPIRLMSFLFDTAVLWRTYSPLLAPRIVRWVGRCIFQAWPGIVVRPRSAVYLCQGNSPLEVHIISDGQDGLERRLSQRRWDFASKPPFDIVLFELRIPLLGEWRLSVGGTVSITRQRVAPRSADQAAGEPVDEDVLMYYDCDRGLKGRLVRPGDPSWPPPPFGFPPLFAAHLRSEDDQREGAAEEGTVWLRFEEGNSLWIVWRPPDTDSRDKLERIRARPSSTSESNGGSTSSRIVRVSFLMVQCFHCYADGYSYYPLIGNLLEMYEEALSGKAVTGRPKAWRPPDKAFEVLQRRLSDTLEGRVESADRHSLRGQVFRSNCEGYTYGIRIANQAYEMLAMCSTRYAIPLDYLLLSLTVLGVARASNQETVEMTLYVPMRDGQEVSMVGLFADWRDITVSVPREHATVLGVTLQITDLLRQRRWAVFDALRKPDRTVVNFMPLDPHSRCGFQQLQDRLWDRNGDTLGKSKRRGEDLEKLLQPLAFDMIQEHASSWWISGKIGYRSHPPSWTRRFAKAVQEALVNLALEPLAGAHRPFSLDLPGPERSGYSGRS